MNRIGDLLVVGGMAVLLTFSCATVIDALSQYHLDKAGAEAVRKMNAHYRVLHCRKDIWECMT